MNNPKQPKAGGDPRVLPDFVTLRDELAKLSHPARPDIDWQRVETLCLRLFEHNGVELQTAAWYTLAQVHVNGPGGLSEGLRLIEALIQHRWPVMWPTEIHARMEIITRLSQRLQNIFRTLVFQGSDDLKWLYQSEKALSACSAMLAGHEVKQLSRLDALHQQITQAIKRLESQLQSNPSGFMTTLPLPTDCVGSNCELTDVASPEPASGAAGVALQTGKNAVRPFIAGACSALILCGLLTWGGHRATTPTLTEQQLVASLTPLPAGLSAEQLAQLRKMPSVIAKPEMWLALTQDRLKWLTSLSPDWARQYGQTLLYHAHTLWPDDPALEQIQKAWLWQQEVNALPVTALDGWHQGMTGLQQLADRLNTLDEKRGKYLTVSELKSAVFDIVSRFRQTVPTEEQLRAIHQQGDSPAREQQIQQVEQHLRAQIYLLTQEKEGTGALDARQFAEF